MHSDKNSKYIGYYSAASDKINGYSIWRTEDGREVKITQVFEGENESSWTDSIVIGPVTTFISGHRKNIELMHESNPRTQLPLNSSTTELDPKTQMDFEDHDRLNKLIKELGIGEKEFDIEKPGTKKLETERLQTKKQETEKPQAEGRELYRIIVFGRSVQRLSAILDACGENSIMTIGEKSYVVRTTKSIAEKLKADNDWVERVEPYHTYYVSTVVDK